MMIKIKTIKARYIGKDTSGYKHFRIYDLFTWIDNNHIIINSVNSSSTYGYDDVAQFSQDWQVIYGGNENASTRQGAQANSDSTRVPESAGI